MKPLAWMRAIRDSDLPRTVVLTALTLGLRADRYGNCWPSYQQIADDAGCDKRDAIRRVRTLADAGWIMVAKRSNGHGSQSNSYQLTLPHTLWKTQGGGDTRPTPLVTPDPLGGDTRPTPQGVTPDPPRRVTPIEVSTTPALPPVDNRHLAAVVNLLAHQHRIPN